MKSNIDVISEEMIKPSSPTPSHLRKYELSYFDQTAPKFHGPFLFFYTNKGQNPKNSQLLKQSLSQALTLFYPLAGRIIANDSIDCNDVGAVFKEALVRGPNNAFSQIIENPDVESLGRYLPSEPFFNSATEEIPLLVQTNYFPCGGIVIAICFSHKFGDASSMVAFINTWASFSRGAPVEQPIFCLARLSPRKDNMPNEPRALITSEKISTRRFVFSKNSLDILKSLVISSGSKVKDPTRFEALSAFIWNHVKEVVAKSSDASREISGIGVVMNTRQRLTPPQSQNSIGNFRRYAYTMSSSSHDDAVNLLRGIKEKFNAEYVKSLFAEGVSGHDEEGTKSIMAKLRNGEVEVCSFTNLVHFQVYEVDFGWDKPDWVSKVTFPMRNAVIFMRTSSGDGIEAWINLLPGDMDLLERNPVFLSMTNFKKENMSDHKGKIAHMNPKLQILNRI